MTDSMAETRVTPPLGPTVRYVRSNDLEISSKGETTGRKEEEEEEEVEVEARDGIGGRGFDDRAEENEAVEVIKAQNIWVDMQNPKF